MTLITDEKLRNTIRFKNVVIRLKEEQIDSKQSERLMKKVADEIKEVRGDC